MKGRKGEEDGGVGWGSGKDNMGKGESSGGETNWGGEVGKATWGSGKCYGDHK